MNVSHVVTTVEAIFTKGSPIGKGWDAMKIVHTNWTCLIAATGDRQQQPRSTAAN